MTFQRLFLRYLMVVASVLVLGFILFAIGALWTQHKINTLSYHRDMPTCQSGTLHLGGTWGTAEVHVELATTPESRAQGLMFREDLAAGDGMLFVYPEPGSPSFWMRNTLIPLDLMFFDPAGDMRHVHFSAQPHDETAIPGGNNIQFVLEVPAGDIKRLGLGADTTIRHPSIPQDNARWKC